MMNSSYNALLTTAIARKTSNVEPVLAAVWRYVANHEKPTDMPFETWLFAVAFRFVRTQEKGPGEK
ncbi:hypothetical protein [Bremerella sp. P1]|uniref:hypothetical protein n=1 Tax=Bremerella sp. P1 TaxID=3026424 RepID=UPI0023677D99|nr:hypothetical protein [Bremerella sp. P1]WDI40234.1 hypothetical protein PSR63_17275 [Bremerella sp. P1]